jgi:hypothetical protein
MEIITFILRHLNLAASIYWPSKWKTQILQLVGYYVYIPFSECNILIELFFKLCVFVKLRDIHFLWCLTSPGM